MQIPIHFYYLFCRDIENLILKFLVIQHFVYFLFFVWNSYSFFSELKADAPACAPSPSSAGIPFKGAVWLLLYNLLEVRFPKCRSCHAFGIPAESCLFLQNCCLNAGYSQVSVVILNVCIGMSLGRNTTYLFLIFTAMDDPPRPPMDSARSLEMSGYMPCRGDFDVVRN